MNNLKAGNLLKIHRFKTKEIEYALFIKYFDKFWFQYYVGNHKSLGWRDLLMSNNIIMNNNKFISFGVAFEIINN